VREHIVLMVDADSGAEFEALRVELLPGGSVSFSLSRMVSSGEAEVLTRRVASAADVEKLGARLVDHARSSMKLDHAGSMQVVRLEQSVDCLDLSVRASNVLLAAGVATLGDLVRRTESGISRLKNSSRKVAREVASELTKLGFWLAPEPIEGSP